jgi:hypothetical protein
MFRKPDGYKNINHSSTLNTFTVDKEELYKEEQEQEELDQTGKPNSDKKDPKSTLNDTKCTYCGRPSRKNSGSISRCTYCSLLYY